MATDEPEVPSPFDVRTIRRLIVLMSRHDLSEIDLREGDLRIRLLRGGRLVAAPQPTVAAPVLAAPAPTQPAPASTGAAAKPAAEPNKNLVPIKSPTPGTFYVSPNPGSPPFVKVGSKVTPTTVVCVIEAMKIFNEITAECAGVITEILAENQQPVEYNQVLFRVDPTA